MSKLRTECLGRTYEDRVVALRDVTIEIRTGDIAVVLGPSGSGKTTLLNLLATLDAPTEGSVWLDDIELTRLSDRQASRIRSERFGFVFQFFHLLPELTVLENVLLPLWIRDGNPLKRDLYRAEASRLLEEFGLAHRKDALPRRLSGGEMQRVAICRSLVCGPEVIFADEPTGSIDRDSAELFCAAVQQLNAHKGVTFVIATHNERFLQFATKIVYLRDGSVAGVEERNLHRERE